MDNVSGTLTLAIATFIVGAAMYRFVEQPFRQPRGGAETNSRRIVAGYLASIAVLSIVTHTAFLQQGWPWRLSPATSAIAELQSFGMAPCAFFGVRQCAFGNVDRPVGIELVGDSYVQQYVAALDPILKELGLRGETSTFGGCPILIGIKLRGPRAEECLTVRNEIFARLDKSTTPVMFGLAWQGYHDDSIVPENSEQDDEIRGAGIRLLRRALEDTIGDLVKTGHRVMLVGAQVTNTCKIDRLKLLPGPLAHAPQKECGAVTRDTALRQSAEVNDALREIQTKWPDQVTLLFPVDYLCDSTCALTDKGLWLYQDAGHLTVAGSRFIGERAGRVFKAFLKVTPKS